jgi:hypothetical protein
VIDRANTLEFYAPDLSKLNYVTMFALFKYGTIGCTDCFSLLLHLVE